MQLAENSTKLKACSCSLAFQVGCQHSLDVLTIIGGNFAFSAGGQFGRASAGASAGEQLGCQLGPSLVWSVGASAS